MGWFEGMVGEGRLGGGEGWRIGVGGEGGEGQGEVMVRKEDAKNRKTGKRERENEKGMLRG